jgi:hypothetical protein
MTGAYADVPPRLAEKAVRVPADGVAVLVAFERAAALRTHPRLGKLRHKAAAERHRDPHGFAAARGFEVDHGRNGHDQGGPEDLGRGRDAVAQNIDLAPIMSAMFDRLDAWVTAQKTPPASRTVKPPEIAAPLGVYHAYPAELGAARIGLQTAAFAPYDGMNLEPLDGLGRLVDMNGSGTRERRETLSAAWARLGLIASGEIVTHERYIDTVTAAATRLAGDRLLDPAAIPLYTGRARTSFTGNE